MKRVAVAPRLDWEARLREIHFDDYVRADGGAYWIEDHCFELSQAEIATLADAARVCEGLVRAAVVRAIDGPAHLARLGLGEALAELALTSWARNDPSLYGRFDFAWDGEGPPKLLEYNADCPTALYEAAVVQRRWLFERDVPRRQFNEIQARLIAGWRRLARAIPANGALHIVSRHSEFDAYGTAWYLGECAEKAGIETCEIDVADIGLRAERLVDLDDMRITHMFKLYPWEWMANEDARFFAALTNVGVMEPAWRAVAASKGVLVDLWEAAPDCPYLLRASWDEFDGERVGKPVFGRQGANVRVRFAEHESDCEGPYAEQRIVWQARAAMPRFDGRAPVFGVWMIAGEPAGLGVREDEALVTGPRCSFIPHRIVG